MNLQKSKYFHELLDEIISVLNDLKDKEISEDLKGIVQKLGDTIRISSLIGDSKESDFIDFEKVPEIWGSDFLLTLVKGIRDRKVLEIYYQPFYEDKPYFIRVHPYLLKEYHYRWYLIGFNENKKELRTYGLDRIWEIKETDLPFISRKFNARDYFKNTVGIISPPGDPPRVRIEVLKPQAHYLITQPLHPSQSIESEDDKLIVFNYRVHPTYEFKALLLGLGSDIIVLEPTSLRNEIIRELQDALEGYQRVD
jgi:predicted DNA-binding transcriptional regulator YafY